MERIRLEDLVDVLIPRWILGLELFRKTNGEKEEKWRKRGNLERDL